ncbi:MAG: hypothetical protein ACHP9Y_01800 [Gammaproteobacteria bacterium]
MTGIGFSVRINKNLELTIMRTTYKKLHKLATLRSVGGAGLTVLASMGLFLSALYSISAYSEGWVPHSIIAALVSIVSLMLVMKGVKVFNQPLSELELALRRKNRGKARHLTLHDLETSDEGENDLQSSEGEELEQASKLEAADLADANLMEAELALEEGLLVELNVVPEKLPELKNIEEQVESTVSVAENVVEISVTDQDLQHAVTQDSAPIQQVPLESVKQYTTKVPPTQSVIQPLETAKVVDKYIPVSFVGPAAQSTKESSSKAEQTSTQNRVENASAKSTETVNTQTTTNTARSGVVVAVTAGTQVIISGTQPLQFVNILLTMVNKVVDFCVKNIINPLTSSTPAAMATPAASPAPSQRPVQQAAPS